MPFQVGFRGSIALVAAVLSLLTLGISFALVSLSVNGSQERQFDEALVAVAQAEALDLSQHPEEVIAISDRPGPAANDVGPLPLFGALYGPDGGVVSATPTFEGAAPPKDILARLDVRPFDFQWHTRVLRGVLVPVASRHARLLVAAPRSDLDGDAAFLRRAMMVIFGIALAWTVLLAFGIATRITRTHRTIVETARRVSAGDLSARVSSGSRTGEMAALARDINQMIDRLAVLLSSQQQFIARAAHELRSPLSTLYGELSHAVRRPRGADEYRAAVEQALRSTRKLKDLTEDLLALARVGARAIAPTQITALKEVAAEVQEELRDLIDERRITVRVFGEDLRVEGRPSDLARMLRNLVENAVRYSPPEGTIDVGFTVSEGTGVIQVVDEGPGVAAEDRSEIFAPFFRRGDQVGSQAGSGLGLTIAREIARLHGGDLLLGERVDQRGALFIVRLPLAATSAGGDERAADGSTPDPG